ncbi:ATP-binding protein [Rhodoferax sp.]|uniref:sensor histidine kinase n=1 Tax=Rhodoferax sp. TaxID=50421 RepID=UPI002605D545|nr:ATP-binding protein [Rhodoferax sp.]MDD2925571.1 7TM diverse intracellular signaling domain-containing protein [Rhodoferax sp.]
MAFWTAKSQWHRLVLLLLVWPLWVGAGEAATHFVTAEVGSVGPGTFGRPPPRVTPADLPTAWPTQPLPRVTARHVAQSVGEASDNIITTWYRLRPTATTAAPDETVYLYLPRWQTIGQLAVYKDGELVWRSRGGPIWNGFNHPVWLPLAEAGEAMPQEVLVRMDSLKSAGGALSSVWIGPERELRWRYAARRILQITLTQVGTSAFLIVGLFSFGVWLRRREVPYALFSAAALFSWLRNLHFYLGDEPLPMPEPWFGWMTVSALGWLVISVYFFNYRLHQQKFPRLERGMVGFMLLLTVLTLPGLVPLGTLATWVNLLLFGMMLVATVAMLLASWRSRSREGWAISLWNVLNIPMGIHDALLQSYAINIENLYLMPYSVAGTFFLFLAILLNRYTHARNEAETSNARLEMRLAQQEQELQASHHKLREAEHQQMLIEERQRLMRDMHDGIGTSLMTALSVVEAKKTPDDQAVATMLRDCVDDLKLTIDSLEPVDADLLLLLAALRFRLEPRFRQTGLTLHWQVEDLPRLEWLEPNSALQVLRILQEVFTNVIKHARASQIRVSTGVRDGGVYVAVEDDGRGFAVNETLARVTTQAPGGKSRGLLNLIHRASMLDGKVSWSTPEGAHGTRFELWLPLTRPKA